MDAVTVNTIWMIGLIGIGVAYGIAYIICGQIGKSKGYLPNKNNEE